MAALGSLTPSCSQVLDPSPLRLNRCVRVRCATRKEGTDSFPPQGWTGGACLGAAQAAQEQGRRTILFIGDGSLQLTVQEISTMIRVGVKPLLVILDNVRFFLLRSLTSY